MKSQLTKRDFEKRLRELISPEKDFYLLTPYNFSGTPFCGTFDNSAFDLTRNSFWVHVKTFRIKGQFKDSDNLTEVVYEVEQTKFTSHFTAIIFWGDISDIKCILVPIS